MFALALIAAEVAIVEVLSRFAMSFANRPYRMIAWSEVRKVLRSWQRQFLA
jgi:hypothetical protein